MQFIGKKEDNDDMLPTHYQIFFVATQVCEKEEDAHLVHLNFIYFWLPCNLMKRRRYACFF
jgi:hypothetical protein